MSTPQIPGYTGDDDINIEKFIPQSQNPNKQNPNLGKQPNFMERLREAWTTRPTRKESPKEELPKSDIFARGKQWERSKLRENVLKKASSNIPGGGGQILQKARIGLEKELFSKRYGQLISGKDNKEMMKKLKETIYKTKDFKVKKDLEHKYKLWGKISGYKK